MNKNRNIPGASSIQTAFDRLKPTERMVFCIAVAIFIISTLFLLEDVNRHFMVTVPARGGSLTEGVIGTPRFINPLLATTQADKDLSALIYSGLMKKDASGNIVPDLAQSYSISPDGLTYTFILKPDVVFADGTAVTADDVIYTIEQAENPTIKSPRSVAWNGVSVAKTDDRTITFTLNQAYGFFLQNTTLGILPAHLWSAVAPADMAESALNTSPVGSGPYSISHISKNSTGVPTEYSLESSNRYIAGKPFIDTLNVKFYQSEEDLFDAFKSGDVDSAYGLSSQDAKAIQDKSRIETSVLPRVFGVFLNQHEDPLFADKAVRQALDIAVNKDAIVKSVLEGFGVTLSGPLPQATGTPVDTRSDADRVEQASAILEKGGWTRSTTSGVWSKAGPKDSKTSQTLSFSLSTGDTPELKAAAQNVVDDWTALGADVDLHVYETSDLNQTIIRPRTYDALLFGESVGWNGDLYPFWHSSQKDDPGLNIALYGNSGTDTLLEDARKTSDDSVRAHKYEEFEGAIASDTPAIFLYSPQLIYAVPKDLSGLELQNITDPTERLNGIGVEYLQTQTIWKIFNNS